MQDKANRKHNQKEAPSQEKKSPPADSWEARKKQELQHLEKRRRREKRFKAYTLGAIFIAGAFLVFFLVDLVIKGYPALKQAEIQTEITYSPETDRKSVV